MSRNNSRDLTSYVHGIPIAAAKACVRCRKIRPAAIPSGPFPRPRQLSDPIRGRLPGPPGGPRAGCAHRARGLRFPAAGPGGDQPSGQSPPGVAGAAPGFCLSPGRPAGSPGRPAGHLLAGDQPLCWRTSPVPTGRAGMQGRAASLPRPRPPRGGPAGPLPPVTVAIPGSGRPPYRQAGPARARTAARVLRMYLPLTSQGPGRGTAGQRRM